MTRNRLHYAVLILCVIVAGLASRRYSADVPRLISAYAGDTLWALMGFLGIGMVWRTGPTWQIAGAALAVAWLVEFSQLYHSAWADAVRNTTLGKLVFGRGFLWSDLVCYSMGVAIGASAEYVLRQFRNRGRVPASRQDS